MPAHATRNDRGRVTRYRTLLSRPGATALVAAGIPARLPIATYGIGLLALGRAQYGGFGPAGAVVAAYVVAAVVASLLLGRPAQRPWYPRLLVTAAVVDFAALVALVAASHAGAGPVPLSALAVLVGLALPPAGVVVRGRWAGLVPAGELDAALFLESALDEAMFVIGPLLVTALGAALGPGTALLLAAAATTAGLLGLAATSRQLGAPLHEEGTPSSPLPRRTLALLYAGFLALGTGFATIQVGVLAGYPDAPAKGGEVLTWFSVVSLVAGLTAGRLGVTAPLRPGLAVLGAALLVPPLAGPSSTLVLALLLVPAAVCASPSVALGYGQAAALTRADRRGPVFAWCGAALSGGLALGSGVGGLAADLAGPSAPFLAGAVAVLLGAAVAPRAVAARDCSRDLGVAAAGAGVGDPQPPAGDRPGDRVRVRTGRPGRG
jgi:predicted MFS family arabinose efflux permease